MHHPYMFQGVHKKSSRGCKVLLIMHPPIPAIRYGIKSSILTNEKYKGDALLQKTFTVDFLTKKHKQNEGEVPQYYVKGNHECCPYVNTNASP